MLIEDIYDVEYGGVCLSFNPESVAHTGDHIGDVMMNTAMVPRWPALKTQILLKCQAEMTDFKKDRHFPIHQGNSPIALCCNQRPNSGQ